MRFSFRVNWEDHYLGLWKSKKGLEEWDWIRLSYTEGVDSEI